jgi:inosine-uridine nucleoside N-ribohydrolase
MVSASRLALLVCIKLLLLMLHFIAVQAAPMLRAPPYRIPVVLDTDIGTDFDDSFALHYLLSASNPRDPSAVFDLKLVQVSTFNTTKRAQIVANILQTLGRFDVPIAVGEYGGEQAMPEYAVAATADLASFVAKGGLVSWGTGALLAEVSAASPRSPLFVIEISPATSLAAVLASKPSLAANVVVSAMSGSVNRGYFNTSISREYNVIIDIPASSIMYQAAYAAPLFVHPLDTTVFDQFVGDVYGLLLKANATSACASSLLRHYEIWYQNGGDKYGAILPFSPYAGPGQGTSTLYDVQAAWAVPVYAAALAQGRAPALPWTDVQTINLIVNASGYTVADATQGRSVYVALRWLPVNETRAQVAKFGLEIIESIVRG